MPPRKRARRASEATQADDDAADGADDDEDEDEDEDEGGDEDAAPGEKRKRGGALRKMCACGKDGCGRSVNFDGFRIPAKSQKRAAWLDALYSRRGLDIPERLLREEGAKRKDQRVHPCHFRNDDVLLTANKGSGKGVPTQPPPAVLMQCLYAFCLRLAVKRRVKPGALPIVPFEQLRRDDPAADEAAAPAAAAAAPAAAADAPAEAAPATTAAEPTDPREEKALQLIEEAELQGEVDRGTTEVVRMAFAAGSAARAARERTKATLGRTERYVSQVLAERTALDKKLRAALKAPAASVRGAAALGYMRFRDDPWLKQNLSSFVYFDSIQALDAFIAHLNNWFVAIRVCMSARACRVPACACACACAVHVPSLLLQVPARPDQVAAEEGVPDRDDG